MSVAARTAVIVDAERLKRALTISGLIDRRSGESHQSCIRQCSGKVVSEIPAGRPMSFIQKDNHVVPGQRILLESVELMYHRDDKASKVSIEKVLQFLF